MKRNRSGKGLKARLALGAIERQKTVSELAPGHEVHVRLSR